MQRSPLVTLVSIFFWIGASIALAGCGQSATQAISPPPAFLVKTSPATSQEVDNISSFLGEIRSLHSVSLKPQVSGLICKIFVRSGEQVQAGTPVFLIDPQKQKESLNSLQAAVETHLQEQHKAYQLLKSLEAERVAKQANLEFSKRQHERYLSLHTGGAVSLESVDQVKNSLQKAQAELEAVEANILAAKATLEGTQKQLKQSAATAKEQEVQLSYYTVTAPFAGEVGDIPVKLGQYVDPSTELTTVDQNTPLEVHINIPADEVAELHKGTILRIRNARHRLLTECPIFFISAHVNHDTQTVLVKGLIKGPHPNVRSNQSVHVDVVWSTQRKILVPTTAIARLSGQDFLFVAENDGHGLKAKQRSIKLGTLVGNSFVVERGLQGNKQIIISDPQSLADNMPIRTDS